MTKTHRLAAVAGAVALLAPAAVADARPGKGKGRGHEMAVAHAAPAATPALTAALTAAAGATAAPAAHAPGRGRGRGRGRGHAKPVTLVLKGTLVSVDGTTATVSVTGGNRRGRPFAGHDVPLDLAAARLEVDDRNADGVEDVADLEPGDPVVVQARVARTATPDGSTIAVRRLTVDEPEVEPAQ